MSYINQGLNENRYDTIIVGAGISGIFTAYSLINCKPNEKILIIEKGKPLSKRLCPLEVGLAEYCRDCKVCNKYCGFGGLGKSEGKYNFTTDFGGALQDKIGTATTKEFLKQAENTICKYSQNSGVIYDTYSNLIYTKAKLENVKPLFSNVRHLGLKNSVSMLGGIFDFLRNRVKFIFDTEVDEIIKNNQFIIKTKDQDFIAKKVVIAVGSNGSKSMGNMLDSFKLATENYRVDLGIRVETKAKMFKQILEKVPEFKISCDYNNETAYTYCMNPYGYIVNKNINNFVFVDGQNYNERGKKSDRLNFTIFVPSFFDTLKEMENSTKSVLESINIDGVKIAVQKWNDFNRGKPTSKEDLANNTITPEVEVYPTNLLNILPKKYTDGVRVIMQSIEKIVGNKFHDDTLLYALDAKLYCPIIKTSIDFQTDIEGLYLVGDCSGVTWSLSQACANGLYLGRRL